MFCPNCGREQAGDVSFCCQCGAAIRSASRYKKTLTLSATDKKIAGVCGGIAEYLEVDSTLVRVIWVLVALTGIGLVVGLIGYPLAWLIIPPAQSQEQQSRHASATPASDSASS
jgi:phage shock protein C